MTVIQEGSTGIVAQIKEQERVTLEGGGGWISDEIGQFVEYAFTKCRRGGGVKSTAVLRAFSEDQIVSMYARWKIESEDDDHA